MILILPPSPSSLRSLLSLALPSSHRSHWMKWLWGKQTFLVPIFQHQSLWNMSAFVRFSESLNVGCLTFCTESFEFDWWENLEKFREETYFRGGDTLCIKLNYNPINIIIIVIIIIIISTPLSSSDQMSFALKFILDWGHPKKWEGFQNVGKGRGRSWKVFSIINNGVKYASSYAMFQELL